MKNECFFLAMDISKDECQIKVARSETTYNVMDVLPSYIIALMNPSGKLSD